MISYMIPKKNHTVYVLNIMYLFPMFVFNWAENKKRFHGVLRRIYRERGVYYLRSYRICMFNNVDSGGWDVRVFFSQWVFYPPWKKNIKVPLKRRKCSRAIRGLLIFKGKKRPWSVVRRYGLCGVHVICFIFSILYKRTHTAISTHRW